MKLEAALFGLPGRIEMVGRRNPRPSTNPRREKSVNSISAAAFSDPYEVCGFSAVQSSIISGISPP